MTYTRISAVEKEIDIFENVITSVTALREETGLNITNPKLVGIKQFPITNGRYIVLLFKATEFSGTVISSAEGDMEWIDIDDISKVNVVEDFYDL